VPPSSANPRSPAATGLEVRPFRALTYRRRDPEQLARVSSPAYDLVTPDGRERLADADPHNIVRLILPRVDQPAGDVPPAEQAARLLRAWLDEGVLVRDEAPALWHYELRPPDDAPPTVGWLGAVTLPPPGSAAVLPHEDTYAPAVEGRRALLAATATDLEPIVLAHDPEPTIADLTQRATRLTPTLVLRDGDGVEHRLRRVTDRGLLAAVATAWRRTGAVIADGHHRFAAAQAHHRERPDRPGSDALLALVTPMGAGGLRVQPIHRAVPDLAFDAALAAATAGFRVRELPVTGASAGPGSAVVAEIGRWLTDPAETGFLISDGSRLARLTDPTDDVRGRIPRGAPAAWRGLDVVLAHHGLLEHLWHRRDDPDSVLIAHDVPTALRLAGERSGVALLLRAPSPTDVGDVARAGARMPRKSTLFVPKPRTGLVLRPLD
jgi:uncharacterized protein (DUF1015 family)